MSNTNITTEKNTKQTSLQIQVMTKVFQKLLSISIWFVILRLLISYSLGLVLSFFDPNYWFGIGVRRFWGVPILAVNANPDLFVIINTYSLVFIQVLFFSFFIKSLLVKIKEVEKSSFWANMFSWGLGGLMVGASQFVLTYYLSSNPRFASDRVGFSISLVLFLLTLLSLGLRLFFISQKSRPVKGSFYHQKVKYKN